MQTGEIVDTPLGRGVVIGKLSSGKIVVKLDLEIERPDYIITARAFEPEDVRAVEE